MNKIKGNLLTVLENGDVEIIGHCCNCQKTMGSGIAKGLRDKWPKVYEADIEFKPELVKPWDRLGDVSIAKVGEKRYVANLYGQLKYGAGQRQVNYEAIYNAILKMKRWCYDLKLTKVGFPHMMASDRAGGDWRIIESMIEAVFVNPNEKFEVTIVNFN